MLGDSSVAAQLAASQEGLSSMESVGYGRGNLEDEIPVDTEDAKPMRGKRQEEQNNPPLLGVTSLYSAER
jgi:hypothetical protein